ncbi:UNVERIFIED_CONTAM: Eukaryotic translation initiation factor 3 subunit I [Sesamum indicum]
MGDCRRKRKADDGKRGEEEEVMRIGLPFIEKQMLPFIASIPIRLMSAGPLELRQAVAMDKPLTNMKEILKITSEGGSTECDGLPASLGLFMGVEIRPPSRQQRNRVLPSARVGVFISLFRIPPLLITLKMRPILMKGHERPLTFLKYNRDGDLLFSCAKDHNPTVWFADNGERLGTYRGHNGAVWSCDISRDSTRLITGSADQTAKLWDVKTGTPLYTFNFDSPARSVDFAVGDRLAVITTDPFMGLPSAIHIKRIARDPEDQTGESVLILKGPQGRINRAVWGPLNRTIISAGEDSVIRIWDSETGKLLKESDKEDGHKKPITSLSKSTDGSHFLTGSLDKSAKLWDIRTLKLIKTYVTERPVNAVAMSPLLDHVVLGGGQDASAVTTTDHRAGKFEAKFYDKILTEEIGGVKGHFGPINALAFNPDGKSFSSGGEDGYVRLHHFDPDYFNIKI